MVALTIGICIGLIVGWNLLPQPKWINSLYHKAVDRFTS